MNSIFQVLTLAWSLQGGQYFNQNMNDSGVFTSFSPIYIDLTVELQFPLSLTKGGKDQVFISYENFNSMIPYKGLDFTPLQETYTASAGIRFLDLEIGYQHQCSHPVESIGNTPSNLFSSYDKFYGKISGSF